jgi:prepilin-type N-terminal cleavage/methylation domain-containing protein
MKNKAFTLTEMLVALAVGMLVVNIAFTSFFFTQKFIRKTEELGAKNDVAQAMMLWSLSGKTATYPSTAAAVRGIQGRFAATAAGSGYQDAIVYTELTPKSISGTTVTTSKNHGLVVGMEVDLVVGGTPNTRTVTVVTSTNAFTYSGASPGAITAVRPILGRLCLPRVN